MTYWSTFKTFQQNAKILIMQTIYKYPLKVYEKYNSIQMPKGAKVLSAAFQGREIMLWALVDTDNAGETRYFKVFATGEDSGAYDEKMLMFIDTIFIDQFVFHVFEYKMS